MAEGSDDEAVRVEAGDTVPLVSELFSSSRSPWVKLGASTLGVLAVSGLLYLASDTLAARAEAPREGPAGSSRLGEASRLFFTTPPRLLPWGDAVSKALRTEALLTNAERHSLLVGTGFNRPEMGSFVGATKPIKRLGVPPLKMQDSGNGFRPLGPNEYGTVTSWPSMLTLASSWDEGLVRRVAAAIATEFKGKGANVLLGPGVNVNRVAYGGRNWEYLSGDDPYLGSRLVPAYIEAVQDKGVMAVVKHFAFNEQETDRNLENSVVGERTAWQIYYPPFEAAVNAGVGAFMCSYNRFNGTHSCGNSQLLQRDLKGTMGFPGFVMSDWEAIHSPFAVESGTDMEQPAPKYFTEANLAQVSPESVREAARRVLAAIYRLRLDEHPGCELPCEEARATNQRTEAHLNLAEEAATEGVVLLRNVGILPLNPSRVRSLAVIGSAASAKDQMNTWGPGSPYSGGGSGHVASPSVVTPLDGISERAQAAGMRIITAGGDASAPQTDVPQASEAASRRLQGTLDAIKDADVVVVVAATTATESSDRFTLNLDDGADMLIQTVAAQKPTIVLMEIPGPVLTPWRDQVSAAACLFTGGERTGKAWASILFGDAAPAGKLPVALPMTVADTLRPHPGLVYYSEGLFTSYRSPIQKAAYPFGHGLTYTHFAIGQPGRYTQGCYARLCLSVNVTNVGPRAGKQVVQAYVRFRPSAGEPNLMLRGFRKTRELVPGEESQVSFLFSDRDLSIYDDLSHTWRLQDSYQVLVGASSEDIRGSFFTSRAASVPIHSVAALLLASLALALR